MKLAAGQRIRLPDADGFVVLDGVIPRADGGYKLYVIDSSGVLPIDLAADDLKRVEVLEEDGGADSRLVLAGLWAEWMRQVTHRSGATARDATSLRPYPHQGSAVYGAMLPQPLLRFLLADEPGTGKTIMAGLWLRESQRLGFAKRALVVAPAHLVSKWQDDFRRFLNLKLQRITMNTIREEALSGPHQWWIVSLDLAAVNPAVYEAVHPDRAGWDAVVFDEAHRLTPTAEQYYKVGRMLSRNTSRALLMTATPHRGDEWLFRSLMSLVDPQIFPEPPDVDDPKSKRSLKFDRLPRLKPGRLHFLRRMKEELYDYDGETPLFKPREARNITVPLNVDERGFYNEALDLVEEFFPQDAVVLAKMVYGKRAASALYSLRETLMRRRDRMGQDNDLATPLSGDPYDWDETDQDEARVVNEVSKAGREEKSRIDDILERLDDALCDTTLRVSKWPRMVEECLRPHGIYPGSDKQVVVFTEFADTADWLTDRFDLFGYTARRYSGADSHAERDEIRAKFAAGEFQVIVSTDAGNEGIDLQTASVLVNWDMPWSLVRLEQRMGRIHRIGQDSKVWLYNLIATDTREGDAYARLLDKLMEAANELDGKMFDSLSMVGERALAEAGIKKLEDFLKMAYKAGDSPRGGGGLLAESLSTIRQEQQQGGDYLASSVDINDSLDQLYKERLERINPHIVERFLTRLAEAELLDFKQAAVADRGFWYLTPRTLSFPKALLLEESTGKALVSTSGQFKTDAVDAGVSRASDAVTLGPGEPVFAELAEIAGDHLRPFLYQGALLEDNTTVTDYELHLFAAEVAEGGGRRKTAWSYLIRVDDTGARLVAWETLSNLKPANKVADRPHPARKSEAAQAAQQALWEERDDRTLAMESWAADARQNLRRLPDDLSNDIPNREQRLKIRGRTEAAVESRIADLDEATRIEVGDLTRIGWARVQGAAEANPEEKNSEEIAMRLVIDSLAAEGWKVADVHTEGRGYDLHARRGNQQRCVEVKGIWGRASSRGVTLTGNEMVRAGLLADDYWLYIVDSCSEGGILYFAYQNPAVLFANVTHDITSLHIKGSDLEIARTGQ